MLHVSSDLCMNLLCWLPKTLTVRNVGRLLSLHKPSHTTFANTQALQTYARITHKYPDLAIAQYARIKHALLLFQSGRTTDAVLEMEGEEEELRGLAEVHAALAAMLYSESPKQISRAETQWEIAREFDQRYANLDWVKHEKHWPPAMQTALGNFLSLR